MEDRVVLGNFGAPHGVRGWVKVFSYTSPVENIFEYPLWQIEIKGTWKQLEIEDIKKASKEYAVKINGYETRDDAAKLTNCLISVFRHELPVLQEEEYYWSDLIGLKVVTVSGVNLGVVDSLLATGSNDVLVVKGDKLRMVPYTSQVIQRVNLNDKVIVVDWDPDF
jgi:16S rRNA processing protein RimM